MGSQIRYLALSCFLLALTGCGSVSQVSGPGPSPTPTQAGPSVTVDHVFLVLLENHGYSQVIGSASMPYLNSLANQHALATNYFADTHPSLGNYFMLTVGNMETNPIVGDSFIGPVPDNNVARALTGAGKSWKAYMESLPSAGYTSGDVYPYFKHHNPFAYLTDVLGSSSQAANMVPFTQLAADAASGSLPSFGFIAPNAENDSHDCPAGGSACTDADKLLAADTWLRNNIDPLINSAAVTNSVVIIVFDESLDIDIVNGGGKVAMVMAGAHVKTGFQSTTFYQHQSTLRVILDLLRVTDHPGISGNAASMQEFFQ